jgi:hypothetical protein
MDRQGLESQVRVTLAFAASRYLSTSKAGSASLIHRVALTTQFNVLRCCLLVGPANGRPGGIGSVRDVKGVAYRTRVSHESRVA